MAIRANMYQWTFLWLTCLLLLAGCVSGCSAISTIDPDASNDGDLPPFQPVPITIQGEGAVEQEQGNGGEVTLTAVPAEGWVFVGWFDTTTSSDDPVSDQDSWTFLPGESATIEARFEPVSDDSDDDDGDGDGVPDGDDDCPNTPAGQPVDVNGCVDSQKDSDGDGVTDDIDECADTPGNVDLVGCPLPVTRDSDGDAVLDGDDLCPGTAADAAVDSDGCADSQKDSDGDSVADDIDECPTTESEAEVNEVGCPDSDGDGVYDNDDQCSGTSSGNPVDQNGCPVTGGGGGGPTPTPDPCASVNCDDSNPCTTDACSGGTCTNSRVSNGTGCDDGNICTVNTCSEGTCNTVNATDGTGCDDGRFCSGAEACVSGACVSSGDPCISLECDETIDACVGCSDPSECPQDDGNDCTAPPTCDAGVCSYESLAADTECGDPSDTECDNPDTCDGAGSCQDNYESAGTACGDLNDTECANPDTCNGSGSCEDNLEPDGTPCADGVFCNGSEVCDANGACQSGDDPCPPFGLVCDVDNDVCDCALPSEPAHPTPGDGAASVPVGTDLSWNVGTASFRLLAGTGSDGPNPFSLVELQTDPVAEMLIGPARYNPGLDFDPNGVLYGASSSLRIIDPTDGTTTTMGSIDSNTQSEILMRTIAFAPDGMLYGVSNGDRILYVIDPANAFATEVGPIPDFVWGIDFAPDGTLYGAFFDLLKLNRDTGEVLSTVGSLGEFVLDIDFGPDGFIYGADSGLNGSLLYRIDPSDASTTLIGEYDSDLCGVASQVTPPTLQFDPTPHPAALSASHSNGEITSAVRDEQALQAQLSRMREMAAQSRAENGGAIEPQVHVDGDSTIAAARDLDDPIRLTPSAQPCPVTYDVYFDSIDPPSTVVCVDASSPTCAFNPLNHSTTYYWQVVSKSCCGQRAGPVWSFTTIRCDTDADCDDGLFCSGEESCDNVSGNCRPVTPPDCDDGVGCTVDFCNETTGSCDNVSNCDNGKFCDGAEICDPVSGCLPGTPVNCDDGVECTDDSCNELTGQCDNLASADCNDGENTLSIDVQGQGSVVLDPAGGTYTEGTVVTLTATESAGYAFSHWDGDLSGSDNPTTILMDADKSVTGVFTHEPGDIDPDDIIRIRITPFYDVETTFVYEYGASWNSHTYNEERLLGLLISYTTRYTFPASGNVYTVDYIYIRNPNGMALTDVYASGDAVIDGVSYSFSEHFSR